MTSTTYVQFLKGGAADHLLDHPGRRRAAARLHHRARPGRQGAVHESRQLHRRADGRQARRDRRRAGRCSRCRTAAAAEASFVKLRPNDRQGHLVARRAARRRHHARGDAVRRGDEADGKRWSTARPPRPRTSCGRSGNLETGARRRATPPAPAPCRRSTSWRRMTAARTRSSSAGRTPRLDGRAGGKVTVYYPVSTVPATGSCAPA